MGVLERGGLAAPFHAHCKGCSSNGRSPGGSSGCNASGLSFFPRAAAQALQACSALNLCPPF
eukprot:3117327-Amphidinium_carterae.1